jgi:hypothetical protein
LSTAWPIEPDIAICSKPGRNCATSGRRASAPASNGQRHNEALIRHELRAHLGVARINCHLQFVAPATNIKRAVVLIREARSQTGGDARQNPEKQPALPRFCPISTSLRPTYRQISPSDDNVKIADNKTSDSAKPSIGLASPRQGLGEGPRLPANRSPVDRNQHSAL